jgi:hypothetical protein
VTQPVWWGEGPEGPYAASPASGPSARPHAIPAPAAPSTTADATTDSATDAAADATADATADVGLGAVPARADVVIVGGGFTGLWTAHYLLRAEPGLDVVVLEAEHVGFGASGRNGGWVSALWPVGPDALARRHGRAGALAMLAELRHTVDEVGAATQAVGIECGFRKGGTLSLARSSAQAARAHAEVAHSDSWGIGTVWLEAAAARERLAASEVQGATFNPNAARLDRQRTRLHCSHPTVARMPTSA